MAITALWDFGEADAQADALLPLVPADGAASAGGSLSLVFSQLVHLGPGDDLLAAFRDGAAFLRIAVGEDGAVMADLGADPGIAAAFSTHEGIFAAGDTLRATLSWTGAPDATLGAARLVVENLTSGARHECPAQPAPGLPDTVEDPAFWQLPGDGADGASTAFQGAIRVMGFYDSAADIATIVGHGLPETPDVADDDAPADASDAGTGDGAVLDIDSEDALARVAQSIEGLAEGAPRMLTLRASDVADGGDSFRVFWNGEALARDGETRFFPPSDGYETYAFAVTGGGSGADMLEIEGQGGPGGVAIAIEDVRLAPAGAGADLDDPDAATSEVEFTFEGGMSDQASSIGAYVVDPETGALSQPRILFENTLSSLRGGPLEPGSTASMAVPQGAQIGMFVIGGGAHYNDFAALGPGSLAFVTDDGAPATLHDSEPQLLHIGEDGTRTLLDGPIFHAAPHDALNPDGVPHLGLSAANDDGTHLFGFSDTFGTAAAPGPQGMLVSVDGRAAQADFLAPDGFAPEEPQPLFADEDAPEADAEDAVPGDPETGDGAPGAAPEAPESLDASEPTGLLILLPTARLPEPEPMGDGFPDEAGAQDTSGTAPAAPHAMAGDATADPATLSTAPAERSAELAVSVIVPCFTPGTLIDAAHGRVPVETLRPGDRVLTRDNGFQPLEWVGRKDVTPDEMARHPRFRGVRIRAGALGAGQPERDMVVSPQHRILLVGPEADLMFGVHEVLAPAIHMVGIPGVEADSADAVSYIHIMCRRHQVVRSDGLWSESFQPGDLSLAGLDEAQRAELLALFPDLASVAGRRDYVAARRSLHRYETIALMAPRRPRRVAAGQAQPRQGA